MPVSQNQRLRKAAAKAAKRKAVVTEKLEAGRRELAISKPRHIDFAASPVVDCTMTQDFETTGIGTLLVARKLSLGRHGVCFFLLDLWCLGVQDAYFSVLDDEEYGFYREQSDAMASAPMEIGVARKLVRDAVAYGKSNGFAAPDDFSELDRIFGDVAPAADATFTFGVEGKPYYRVGPNDPPSRVRRIMETLEFNLGRDGFQFEYPVDEDDDENGVIEGKLATEPARPEPL